MPREFLGGFELLVLLALIRLGDEAYGVRIGKAIQESSGRNVALGSNQCSAELLVYSACVLSGWIVAKLHGEHAVAAVCLYSAAVLFLEYGMIGWLLTANPGPPGVSRTTVIIPSLISVSARPFAVLVGGLWGAPKRHAAVANGE